MEFEPYISNDRLESAWLNGASLRDRPSIAGYLVNFAAGRSATPESDFMSNLNYDSDDVLRLGIGALKDKWPYYPRLVEYDLSREAKYGLQGWIYPLGSDDMISKINDYYRRCHNPCKPSEKALKAFMRYAESAQLRPYTYAEVIKRGLDKSGLDTNSGLPLFMKRSKCIRESVQLASDCAQSGRIFPAVIGARSIKNKMRLIFMAPFEQNLRELSYVYPVMDYLLRTSPHVTGWRGQPDTQVSVSENFFGGKRTQLSTDFTGMDMTVGPEQIKVALSCFELFFLPQYRDDLRQVMLQSSTQPIVCGALTSPGNANQGRNRKRLVYLQGTHGLLSGLGFTNLVETMLQLILDLEFDEYYPMLAAEVNGDDGIKSIDGHKSLDKVADTFATLAHRYGFDANPDKQLVSYDELHYLQRVYSPETEWGGMVHGAYPLLLTLNSAKNPERYRNLTPTEAAVRLIMIFENMADSPLRDTAIRMLIAGSPTIQEWMETGSDLSLSSVYDKLAQTGDTGSNLGTKGFDNLWIVKTIRGEQGLLEDALKDYGAVI